MGYLFILFPIIATGRDLIRLTFLGNKLLFLYKNNIRELFAEISWQFIKKDKRNN